MTNSATQLFKIDSSDIKSHISSLTPQSPSTEIYDLIAKAIRSGVELEKIFTQIQERTGVDVEDLRFAGRVIRRNADYPVTSEAVALTIDARTQLFGHGMLLRRTADGRLWRFFETHWNPVDPGDLRPALTNMALEYPARYGGHRNIAAAVTLLRDLAPVDDQLVALPAQVINVSNCELRIGESGELERHLHRPESRLTRVLPVKYDANASCPELYGMLGGMFERTSEPSEMVRHIVELLGYAIQPVRNIPTIVILWGGGSNGKTKILEILQKLLGPKQVYSGTLGHISADRFTLPNLEGKLLFVEDDASSSVRLDDGLLKKLCENKLIDTRRVASRSGMSFYSTILPIIAGNNVPEINDTSEGMRRRLQVIIFERSFGLGERDDELANRIVANELPGVLNLVLAGLVRLRKRGDFAPPQRCLQARDELLIAANPLLSFLDDACERRHGVRIGIRDLYCTFCEWMRAQRRAPPFGEQGLSPRLQGLGFRVHKNDQMVVEGLCLK